MTAMSAPPPPLHADDCQGRPEDVAAMAARFDLHPELYRGAELAFEDVVRLGHAACLRFLVVHALPELAFHGGYELGGLLLREAEESGHLGVVLDLFHEFCEDVFCWRHLETSLLQVLMTHTSMTPFRCYLDSRDTVLTSRDSPELDVLTGDINICVRAVRENRPEALRLLLRHGEPIDFRSLPDTPLDLKTRQNLSPDTPLGLKTRQNLSPDTPLDLKTRQNFTPDTPLSLKTRQNLSPDTPLDLKTRQNLSPDTPLSPEARQHLSLVHHFARCLSHVPDTDLQTLEVLHQFGANLWERDVQGRLPVKVIEDAVEEEGRVVQRWRLSPVSETGRQEVCARLRQLMSRPLSLKSACRLAVTRAMGTNHVTRLLRLPRLPPSVLAFLRFDEL